jgi:hypothetical protein
LVELRREVARECGDDGTVLRSGMVKKLERIDDPIGGKDGATTGDQ